MNKFFYYGLSPEEYKKCLPYIREKTHKMSGLILGLASITVTSLLIVSLFISKIALLRPVYLIFAILLITCYVLHRFIKKRFYVLEIYTVMVLCLALGSSLSFPFPDQKGTIFSLLIVVLPTLFTERFRNMLICLVSSTAIYITLIFLYKSPEVMFWEIYNSFVLMIVALLVHWSMGKERCIGYISVANNERMIVKLENTQKELKYLSENDVLSTLRNRRKLFKTMSHIEKKEIEPPKGVIMMDIDDFKKYNDKYGHSAGDQCITAFGTMLKKFEEKNKIKFYRYGGEEFIGLYWCDDNKSLTKIAKDISVKTTKLKLDKSAITVSIGIVLCDSSELNYEQWIAYADKSLYKAKAKGKNCVCCWNDKKKK